MFSSPSLQGPWLSQCQQPENQELTHMAGKETIFKPSNRFSVCDLHLLSYLFLCQCRALQAIPEMAIILYYGSDVLNSWS